MFAKITKASLVLGLVCVSLARADSPQSPKGEWKTAFLFEGAEGAQVYQLVKIKISPTAPDKYQANVKVVFGKNWNDKVSLSYGYQNIAYDAFTGNFQMNDDASPLQLAGTFDKVKQELRGNWSSTLLSKNGEFVSSRGANPAVPKDAIVVQPLDGTFRGSVTTRQGYQPLPPRMQVRLSTYLDLSSGKQPVLKGTGELRFYVTDYDEKPPEYTPGLLQDINYNFADRSFTATTTAFGGALLRMEISETGKIIGTISVGPESDMATLELTPYSPVAAPEKTAEKSIEQNK